VTEIAGRPPLEYAVAARALPGEKESGDLALVTSVRDGALVAAVDGLGHGAAAAAAATCAVDVLRAYAHEPLVRLAERCDAALRRTRGVAMSLARFSAGDDTVTWLGVGNVEGALLHRQGPGPPSRESLIPARGIAGARLPALRPATLDVRAEDVLVFATDGIEPAFVDVLRPVGTAREIAERILRAHAKETDDALVLVARYLGSGR
jgi:negative regulator of sigma-B (phosphoserine phosphatase)